MTTMHLGVEELIARQRKEAMQHTVRHAWHLSEFWRRERHPKQPLEPVDKAPAWPGELVELGITQARLAMV